MKKRIPIFLLLLVLFSIGFNSCEEATGLGEDFIVKEPVNLYYMDTVTLKMSTVQFDSLPTSTTGTFLLGYHEDAELGSLTAKSYFQLSLDSISGYPGTRATYQDLSLRLYYDGYSYYDTTQSLSFSVYQLVEDIEYNDDGYLYNTSSFDYQQDSRDGTVYIGKGSFLPRPNQFSYVDVPLDDWLGEELFQLAKDKDDIFGSLTLFQEKYKGFVLVPDEESGPIVRFTTSSQLLLQYQESGELQEIIFPVNNQICFSQISTDHSNTPLAALGGQKESLPSTETDNKAFLQGGAGLGIRVEFPYLKKLLELEENDFLTQAFLELAVVKSSYSGSTPIPEELSIYVVDGLNRISSTYSTSMSRQLDDEFGDDTRYRILLTSYIKEQLQLQGDNQNALLFVLPETSFYSSFNRLITGNQKHENQSLLKLYYLNYESNQ